MSLQLALTNNPNKRSSRLLDFVDHAAQTTMGNHAKRHIYILTCYFDIEALVRVILTISKRLKQVTGIVDGVTVAIDVGEWIRCRMSRDELIKQIALAAKVSKKHVKVLLVQVPGHLLHAKAYAAIKPYSKEKGFVVITSGNTTQRGLGLSDASNLEIATLTTEHELLVEFVDIMHELAINDVTDQREMEQDEFLKALALFSSGVFYHHWRGSLGAEIRFKLTLTNKGKKARLKSSSDFNGYQPIGNTMSRSTIDIQNVFRKIPKPFYPQFWKNYAIDTLLDYWVPCPIAKIVDQKLDEDVKPYLTEIHKLTTPQHINSMVEELNAEVSRLRNKGLIEETQSIVDVWQDRVMRFRNNIDLIKLRIHPYRRIPQLLTSETRLAILETATALREHLSDKKTLSPTKSVVVDFFAGKLTLEQLDLEWSRIGQEVVIKSATIRRPSSRG
jgi:hypothetical protein